MPAFSVSKSISLDAPIGEVFSVLRDFKQWVPWSPWLIAEPGCALTFSSDGRGYAWSGSIVGAGEIQIKSEERDARLVMRLTFLKPWKSVSETTFDLVVRDGLTEVTWSMEGALPLFLFWMKNSMAAYVGRDYERGLAMLKDYVETGEVPSRITCHANTAFLGTSYVGVRETCIVEEIAVRVRKLFEQLEGWRAESGEELAGRPFTICHRFDPTVNLIELMACYPTTKKLASAPAGMVVGEIPPMTTYAVSHRGPYRHISNAWAVGEMHARAKLFRRGKQSDPFEVYLNDPRVVEEQDILTMIHFPTRGERS